MAETTGIAWAHSTFNPWIGCTKVGPGCDNCYAAVSTPARTMGIPWGAGMPRRRTSFGNWQAPIRWERAAEQFRLLHGTRRRVFCASLSDVWDNEVPTEWRAELFELIKRTPSLDWLVLTKRVGNVLPMLEELGITALPSNVWLGISAVNQQEARRDLPKLARIDASVRWLSYEPALGELNLLEQGYGASGADRLIDGLDWVIAGGESGPNARPIQPAWVESLRNQCASAHVAYFFKQWGGATASAGGCELDGQVVKEWPTVGRMAGVPQQRDPINLEQP